MFKNFMPLRVGSLRRLTVLGVALAGLLTIAPLSNAALMGTVTTGLSQTVFPGLVPAGTAPGTLLASLTSPYNFNTTAGTTLGTLSTAVYREAGGTLDFYYQVANNALSSTAIARESNTNFAGYTIATGFRVDGGSLVGSPFVNGTVSPVAADSNGTGSVIGFNFNPPDGAKVLPGLTSSVLVISTNATNYTNGNAAVIDGGTQTVAAFQPAPAGTTTPEPASMLLIGAGLLGLAGFRRIAQRKA